MSEIRLQGKINKMKDNLNFSIPKDIKNAMDISEGDLFEIRFDETEPTILKLEKIDLKSKKYWFIIEDERLWRRQIQDGYWNLDNEKTPDLKLFESVKPNDVILAYSKNPSQSIQNILITKKGYDQNNRTIDIQNIWKLQHPITYSDFDEKNLNILLDYRKRPRRSIISVSEGDFKKITYKISKDEKLKQFNSILRDKGLKIDIGKCTSEGYLTRAINKYLNPGIDKDNDVNFEDCIKLLNKAIERDPNGTLPKFIRSMILKEIGTIDDDLSGSFEGYLEMGLLKYQSEKYDEAFEYLQKSIRKKPDADFPWFVKGLILEGIGNIEDAEQCYKQALTINPENPDPLINIGNIEYDRDNLDGAFEYYQKASEINPDDPEPLSNMAIICHDQKRYEDAILYNEDALRIDPTYYKALCNTGIILNDQEKWNEALVLLNRSLEINSNDWICLLNKAIALFEIGEHEAVLSICDELLSWHPNNAKILNQTGNFFRNMDKLDGAIQLFHSAIEINPTANYWSNIALAYDLKGDYKTAIQSYKNALELEPERKDIKEKLEKCKNKL